MNGFLAICLEDSLRLRNACLIAGVPVVEGVPRCSQDVIGPWNHITQMRQNSAHALR